MLPSGHDYLILRQRGPTLAYREDGCVLQRGVIDFRPRRLSYPKLAASLLRQIANASPQALDSVSLVMPAGQGTEAEDTLALLSDLPALDLRTAVFPALLDQLHSGRGHRVVAVLGEGESSRGAAHAQLARSLAAQNPQLEQRLAQELSAYLGRIQGDSVPAGFSPLHLVVEERPGKAVTLDVANPSVKHLAKKWQALAAKVGGGDDTARAPMEATDGWGVGALILADPPRSAAGVADVALLPTARLQPPNFASLSLRLGAETINLDTGPRLHEIAARWFSGLTGLAIDALRRVVICVPWVAPAVTIASSFVPRSGAPMPRIYYPDLLQGWQPLLSLLEFLGHPDAPGLFVYTGRYPEVHLVAVWK